MIQSCSKTVLTTLYVLQSEDILHFKMQLVTFQKSDRTVHEKGRVVAVIGKKLAFSTCTFMKITW